MRAKRNPRCNRLIDAMVRCSIRTGPPAGLTIPGVRVLSYGHTWRGPRGLSCVSRLVGLTCTNRQAHGFFLSRGRYRVY